MNLEIDWGDFENYVTNCAIPGRTDHTQSNYQIKLL